MRGTEQPKEQPQIGDRGSNPVAINQFLIFFSTGSTCSRSLFTFANILYFTWFTSLPMSLFNLFYWKWSRNNLKVNCKGFTSWCHMKELSKCWRTICVSLKSAKKFSSYEALKMGRGIVIEIGKCRFPTFRTPHYHRKWRHRWTVILGERLLVFISSLLL